MLNGIQKAKTWLYTVHAIWKKTIWTQIPNSRQFYFNNYKMFTFQLFTHFSDQFKGKLNWRRGSKEHGPCPPWEQLSTGTWVSHVINSSFSVMWQRYKNIQLFSVGSVDGQYSVLPCNATVVFHSVVVWHKAANPLRLLHKHCSSFKEIWWLWFI